MRSKSRWHIFFRWLLVQIVVTVVAALLGLFIWQSSFAGDPTGWEPINDFTDIMGSLVAFGWVASLIWPTTWISLICLAVALWRRTYKPLYIVAICAALYGLFWPVWFTGIMGI